MEAVAFANWVSGIRLLDPIQRGHAHRELALAEADHSLDGPAVEPRNTEAQAPPPERKAALSIVAPKADLLRTLGQQRIARSGCPHCGWRDVHRWGQANGKPRYRCISCRKTFNAVTGTPLAGLHHPERWTNQAQALINGVTIARAAAGCGVAFTTAFRWRHRFLAALNLDKPRSLSGIVEADETFILESFKGKRDGLPRVARKRGGKARKAGLSAEQIPVMVARDRAGATIDAVLPRLNAVSIAAALGKVISPAAELCCDGGSAITAFARRAGLGYHVLPAPGGPRPGAPEWHINNVNGYHGRLKEWMRRFHGVATKNLPSYLSWRRTTEALGNASTPEAWVLGAVGLGPYQQGLK